MSDIVSLLYRDSVLVATDLCVRFGRRLRQLRTDRGLTQQQLADFAETGRQHISDLETGRREPGLRVLGSIGKALGVNLAELLTGL